MRWTSLIARPSFFTRQALKDPSKMCVCVCVCLWLGLGHALHWLIVHYTNNVQKMRKIFGIYETVSPFDWNWPRMSPYGYYRTLNANVKKLLKKRENRCKILDTKKIELATHKSRGSTLAKSHPIVKNALLRGHHRTTAKAWRSVRSAELRTPGAVSTWWETV
jgi:hypothetical protein